MSNFSEVKKFIEENMEIYTREALTRKLLKRGYSETDIEEAWLLVTKDEIADKTQPLLWNSPNEVNNQQMNPKAAEANQVNIFRKPEFWLYLFGFLFGFPTFTALFAILGAGFGSYGILGLFTGGLFVLVALIWVIIIISKNWRNNRALSRGLLTGLLLSILLPFIPYFIVAGICTTYFNKL